MRVALISSEFSGLPGSGGIGSYFLHCARCLADAGHFVEVFTAGEPGQLVEEERLRFHQLGSGEAPFFAVRAAEAFAARHQKSPFDILEGAELGAEAAPAAKLVPTVALVVRMHSPSILLNRYLDLPPSRGQKLIKLIRQAQVSFGAFRRGLPIPPIRFELTAPEWMPDQDKCERNFTASADLVIVMSREMQRFVREHWWIPDEAIVEVPNPYRFAASDRIDLTEVERPPTIGFVGRLESRKGILELAAALRRVLPQFPHWKAVVAGPFTQSCISGADVGKMAMQQLAEFGERVIFSGSVPPAEIPRRLSECDICVFPSLWDNFPYVVLEAMAAGKAIVATRVGAVPTMLDDGAAGILVQPGDVRELATSLKALMKSPEMRETLGRAAAARCRTEYGDQTVSTRIVAAYEKAIERRDARLKTSAQTSFTNTAPPEIRVSSHALET